MIALTATATWVTTSRREERTDLFNAERIPVMDDQPDQMTDEVLVDRRVG